MDHQIRTGRAHSKLFAKYRPFIGGWFARIALSAAFILIGISITRADDLDVLNAQIFRLYRKGLQEEATKGAERYRELARARYRSPSRKYANGLSNLAMMYSIQGRYSEAEAVARELIDLERQLSGEDSASYAETLARLGWLYGYLGRYSEVEPLYMRSLEIVSARFGAASGQAGEALSNLAGNYHDLGRLDQAEETYRKALEILIKARGRNHVIVAQTLHNLAGVFPDSRVDEKLALLSECVRILQVNRNVPDENMGFALGSLGAAYKAKGDLVTAEQLLIKATALIQRTQGPTHRITAAAIGHLARLYQRKGDLARAYALYGQATAAAIERTRQGALHSRTETQMAYGRESARDSGTFLTQASIAFDLARSNPAQAEELKREGFALSQWAQFSEAGSAIAQMALRLAAGTDNLAVSIRARQDLAAKRNAINNRVIALMGQRQASSQAELAQLRAQLAAADQLLADADRQIARDSPDFSNLSSHEPVAMVDVAQALADDEVLIQSGFDDDGLLWLISAKSTRWVRVPLSADKLAEEVRALRCGLDEEEWATPTRSRKCADLLDLADKPDPSRPLPFDLARAHALYLALFGEVEDFIAGKRLMIVPSGALTSLPLHVLVTKKPKMALPDQFEGYRDSAWLGRANAIVTLPAVSSIKALRQPPGRRPNAPLDYAGYGDPVLVGDSAFCRSSRALKTCPAIEVIRRQDVADQPRMAEGDRATVRGRGGRRAGNATVDDVFSQGPASDAVLQQVRMLCPLPDTADEIKCVAGFFKDSASLIQLGEKAREVDIKAKSESGALGHYKILHFATHGLLSGDVARMAKRKGEPALVMTPPETQTGPDDDGLLMASEVAGLRLNADWVVLSACNTAAGEKVGAGALSGLARAFFYAGAKSLLVSHWPVYSDAAVRLTAGAFTLRDRDATIGRAEALQRSMTSLMDDKSQADNAHPAVWAPFVIVGDGASR